MKKFASRLIAFLIDFILTSALIVAISSISIFNPNIDSINYNYKKYYTLTDEYYNLVEELDSTYLTDGVISTSESEEIYIKYHDLYDCFKDITLDEGISISQTEELNTSIATRYTSLSNEIMLKIASLNIYELIISIIIYISYFGILQYRLNGQTVGKRLLRIRVINNKDNSKKVSLFKYIIRAILVSSLIFTIIDFIIASITNSVSFYTNVNYYLSMIKYVYELSFIICILIRNDMRSIDDIILGTDVILFDKTGKIVESKIFNEEEV